MDSENNFDSDTSESWSLIDVNCEQSSDGNLTDEIGAEALETRLEEVENVENCSALSGDQEEDASLKSVITAENGENITSGNDHLKNQPDFQASHKKPVFEESDMELCSGTNCEKSNLDVVETIDPETKDVEDDTDGISVISESEFNEGKVNANENDDVWDEKPIDGNVNENQALDNLKMGKDPQVSYGESSEGMSSCMDPKEGCCPNSTDVKENGNGVQRKEPVTPPVYRPNRNNRPGFLLKLSLTILLSWTSYLAFFYFTGRNDSFRNARLMVQSMRKLQKENMILHSRLVQLNRAILATGLHKRDLKEETDPNCLNDESDEYDEYDCRKTDVKLYELKVNEDDYDPYGNRNSLEFSIPYNKPKNVLAFKRILTESEIIFAKESDKTSEPSNLSKHMEALVSDQYTVGTPSAPVVMDGEGAKPVVLVNEKKSEPENEEPGENHEEPKDKNCDTGDVTSQDGETRKENCLEIQEKDVSQYRWFILKDNPKCSEIKVDDLEEFESECLYRIPMEKIYRMKNTEESEDSNGAKAKTDFLKGKDNQLKVTPSERVATVRFHTKSTHDRDKLKEKKSTGKDFRFKKTKKRETNIGFPGRYFDHSEKSFKKKGKNEKEKEKFVVGSVDKYLKYFAKVEEQIGGKLERIKECLMGKNERCEFKFKNPDRDGQPQKENNKKSVEKLLKPDGERKNNKKDQAPKGKKGKTDLRSKKWKTCNIKPDLKCGNYSKCDDDCSCKSGDWFSKWAEGREKCRRDQKLSQWQFDRARSREYSRMGDAFWQFSRAYGRQSRRMYPYSRKKKVRNFSDEGHNKPDFLI